jgi:hypothetical protein
MMHGASCSRWHLQIIIVLHDKLPVSLTGDTFICMQKKRQALSADFYGNR